jgi:hypothetical protein
LAAHNIWQRITFGSAYNNCNIFTKKIKIIFCPLQQKMPHLGKTRRRRCKSRSRSGDEVVDAEHPKHTSDYNYKQTVHLPRLPRKM